MKVTEGKTIYSLVVGDLSEEQHIMEDIPHEYRVVKMDSLKNTATGLMIWGRYKDRWYANPNCRYLIAKLLDVINEGNGL